LKEIAWQEKRFAAADCGSSYAKAAEERARAGDDRSMSRLRPKVEIARAKRMAYV